MGDWWELGLRIWMGVLGVFAIYGGLTTQTVTDPLSRGRNPRPPRWYHRLWFAGVGLAFVALSIFQSY